MSEATKNEATESAKKVPATHKVEVADSISKIALRYRLTVAELLEANELTSSVLRTGQVLKLKK